MNNGILSSQNNENRNIFSETINFATSSINNKQTYSISPKFNISKHVVTIKSLPLNTNNGVCTIILNGDFPEGYSILISCEFFDIGPPFIEIITDNQSIYSAPRNNQKFTGETLELIKINGSWKRLFCTTHSAQFNNAISSVLSSVDNRIFASASSGSATNGGFGNSTLVQANCSIANSTALRYNLITDTAESRQRRVTRSVFKVPFALYFSFDPLISSEASETTKMRLGMISAFQNLLNDGTPTALAQGFEVDNIGNWYAFFHNGSSLSTIDLNYRQSDLGGGQGASNYQFIIYWNPNGTAEWYIQNKLLLRQTGLTYSLPGAQYSSYYFSAATGELTGTGSVSLTILRGNYYSV